MKSFFTVMAAFFAIVFGVGCSTTGNFKIPADTTLMVTNRTAQPDANGNWKTSPFFWAEAGGAQYRLVDASGNTVRSGKLKTHFRVASIFWPPAAIIYWPMGFMGGTFDLTRPGDGYMVTDDFRTPTTSAAAPAMKPVEKSTEESKTPTAKKKVKK